VRAVVQRVSEARVEVEEKTIGRIGPGLLVLLGMSTDDGLEQALWLADKIAALRIFPDSEEKLNLSLLDTGGQILVVSQFTLWGDCRKGNRPSFVRAAAGDRAEPLYQAFVNRLKEKGIFVATGSFGAMMQVHLTNQGPVTLLVDTEKSF